MSRHLWDWHRGGRNGRRAEGDGQDDRPIPELLEALADESEQVGFAAAYTLSALGAEAVPALIAALRDEGDATRWHTMHEKINDGRFTRSTTANASYALSAIGAEAVPALIAEAGDSHWWTRASAAETLGDIGAAAGEALPALSKLASDESVPVRRHAVEALGTVGQGQRAPAEQASEVPPLIRALRDEDVKVRRSATIALARIGPAAEEAVPTLTTALQDEDRYVRGNGAHALRRIGTAAAVETLLEFLSDARWCPITTKQSPY
jgi:HEAT repeat protein